MNKIRELLLRSKKGDAEAICILKDIFNPMIIKYSYLFGNRDEDLYSELVIVFINCITRFHINENFYVQLFEAYVQNLAKDGLYHYEKAF